MKKIAVIGTGGTISALGEHRLDFTNYRTGSLTTEEIVNELHEIRDVCEVETSQLENFSSCDITPTHWLRLKEVVEHYLFERNVDGVVITHGTSTMEETAYFLHLTIPTTKPIVIVGAQRPKNVFGSDAELNLIHAIKVALSNDAHRKGVMIVLNGGIHSAREATKVDTYRIDGLSSSDYGFLGMIDADGTVQFYRKPTRKHTVDSPFAKMRVDALPEVAIVYSYAGASGDMIRFLIEQNKVKGIVIAGTGAGKFSSYEKEALIEAVQKGIVVVRSSRLGNGRVVPLREYEPYRFIAGDNLLPQKARILLMLSLKKTSDWTEIQRFFHEC